MSIEEKAFFEVDSRLLLQLGEKLVKDRAVALSELVKNSYDADATEAVITLDGVKTTSGTIVVRDNGVGMSVSAFKKTWMRIATTDKEEHPFSKRYTRKKAGEKGIGRFACRMLSRKLKVISVAQVGALKEKLEASFNWDEFEPGTNVGEIPISFSSELVDANTTNGTELILEEIREPWNEKDVERLRNELNDLINPSMIELDEERYKKDPSSDPGFKIIFNFPEFPEMEDSLEKSFLEASWAKLSGFVDDKGFTHYEIMIRDGTKREFKRDTAFNHLRNSRLSAYIFIYERKYFNSSDWKVNEARRIGSLHGGIRIYADNFRVFGYGRKGDDWLEVDYDSARSKVGVDRELFKLSDKKRPGLNLFRTQQLFGNVSFEKSSNKLEITVNRDRLIEDENFEELRKFARLGVDYATVIYSNISELERNRDTEEETRKKKIEEEKKELERMKNEADQAIRNINEENQRLEQVIRIAEENRRKAEQNRRNVEEARRNLEYEKRNLESLKNNKREKNATNEKVEDFLWKEEQARIEEIKKLKEEETLKAKSELEKRKANLIIEEKNKERKMIESKLESLSQNEIERKKEILDLKTMQLRVVASTGTLIMIFDHEIRSVISDVQVAISLFSQLIGIADESKKTEYNGILASATKHIKMIEDLGKLLGLIRVGSRSKKRSLALLPIANSVFESFDSYFKENYIKDHIDIPNYLRTPSAP